MYLAFADDARQNNPSRPGMGRLVATGGVLVPGEKARELEGAIDTVCQIYGFPQGEIFKWSPPRGSWFHDQLVGSARECFFRDVLAEAETRSVKAVVVVDDTSKKTGLPDAETHELDVTLMFLERVEQFLREKQADGLIVTDRPAGGRPDEDKFLDACLAMLQTGTRYVKPKAVTYVFAARSRTARLLQLADLVTSCTLARVAGERRYAPQVFQYVLPLFRRAMGRIGGYGVKIHPEYVYVNLYHWILGDSEFIRYGTGVSLPLRHRPYFSDPGVP